jgi:biotin carboxyl carrier protein
MSNGNSLFKELVAFAKDHDLEEIVWEEKGARIAFRRDARRLPRPISPIQNGATAAAQESKPKDIIVTSPMVGTFWRAETKNHPPIVVEGELVEPGDKLAVVAAMKIPTDVVAFSAGHIKKILAENGQPVEYGQPLFVIEPVETASEAADADPSGAA